MSKADLFISADGKQLAKIKSDLGEDEDRLRNRQALFKEWVDCENHLPKNIDQRVIDNFIRQSKFDIERAKKKFTTWLCVRQKYRHLYELPSFEDKTFTLQRQVLISQKLTDDGYRCALSTMTNMDIANFEFDKYIQYIYMFTEYVLLNDINCGYIIIIDYTDLTGSIIGKVPVLLLTTTMQLIVKVHPHRIKEIHLIGLPLIAHALFTATRSVFPDKINKRMIFHKDFSTVSSYVHPVDILPNEFGGGAGSFGDLGNRARDFLQADKKFQTERDTWVLTGDLPKERSELYDFGDLGAVGSFRQLQID